MNTYRIKREILLYEVLLDYRQQYVQYICANLQNCIIVKTKQFKTRVA